jgi:DNA end-binding protein Ku
MPLQGIWTGTIGFSLVAIPVRLVTALESGRISFHLLHGKDYARLARKMYCPEDEAVVPRSEIVRGYENVPGNYVLMTDEELESVSPERSRTIEIVEFVGLKEMDPLYYEHPYYLVPLKGGEKAYRLLAEVLEGTNKAGLAKFVLAEREYLVAITGRQGALVLTTLRYSSEILPRPEFEPKKATADAAEERRLRKSVESMIADFDPGKYADERRKKIRELLAAKAKEQAPVESPAVDEEAGEGPADLVAALEESMRSMKAGKG